MGTFDRSLITESSSWKSFLLYQLETRIKEKLGYTVNNYLPYNLVFLLFESLIGTKENFSKKKNM